MEIGLQFVLYSTTLLGIFYLCLCLLQRKIITFNFFELLTYITLFSLLGVVGEIFVNEIYTRVFGSPMWEYHVLPAHKGSVSYLFFFVWGILGCYRYFSDIVLKKYIWYQKLSPGVVMGAEAVLLELIFNGTYYFLFGGYIFFYFPANLGPLSHLSCLQVIPFYFLFGLVVMKIIKYQSKSFSRLSFVFHWFIIITLVFLV